MEDKLVLNTLPNGERGFDIFGIKISSIGQLDEGMLPQSETFTKVFDIVEKRLKLEQRDHVSVAIESDDFLPISFLEEGVRKKTSVCRIARFFPLQSFHEFIENIQAALRVSQSGDETFSTKENVIEIFSIPQQVADNLFAEDIDPLESLKSITENQLAKINPVAIGTGFLVGGGYLLTNQHVIPDIETAEQCVAQFNYNDVEQGATQTSIDYELDPKALWVSEPELDYTLVQLKPGDTMKQAGDDFGWIQMIEDDSAIKPGFVWVEFKGDRAQIQQLLETADANVTALRDSGYIVSSNSSGNALIIWHPDAEPERESQSYSSQFQPYNRTEIRMIGSLVVGETFTHDLSEYIIERSPGDAIIVIQHPKGRRKQIVLRNNEVIHNGLYRDFVRYKTTTDYGSSGSPVFNAKWELVALHHAAIPVMAPKQKLQEEIKSYQGVRICRIIEDLKQKSIENLKLRGFIDDFVVTKEQTKFPPLPSALIFNSTNDYIDLTKRRSSEGLSDNLADDFSQFTLEAWINPCSSETGTTIFSQVCNEPWYEALSDDSVFGQYLLSLQITPERKAVFSREPLWKIDAEANRTDSRMLYPFLPGSPGKRKHPLDILALETAYQSEVKIALDSKESTDSMKSLQIILYCLGFYDQAIYDYQDNKSYRESYLKAISGELDQQTKTAIEQFNNWVEQKIQVESDAILLAPNVIDLFNKRGSFLGLGTEKSLSSSPKQWKDHYGLRVLELQLCLQSLDWQNPFLQEEHDSQLDRVLDTSITGNFTWPLDYSSSLRDIKGENAKTTAYAVKLLQSAFHQVTDGVFGSSALAALAKAKSYKVATRERLPAGEYSHIAVAFDGQEVKIYLNGQLANRRYTGKQSIGLIKQALIGTGPQHSGLQEARGPHCEEAMTELRIWNTALTAKEIRRRLYRRLDENEVRDHRLSGYWRLEEGQIEDEQALYHLIFVEKHEDPSKRKYDTSRPRERLVQVEKDVIEGEVHFQLRIFDEAGNVVVDISPSKRLIEDKLAVSEAALWNAEIAPEQKKKLLREILLHCGYSLRSYCVYNKAAKGRSYAGKSKLKSQHTHTAVHLQSACHFPTVPLPLGVRVDHEIELNRPNLFLLNGSNDERKLEKLAQGITVECWIKHIYGNGEIIRGGDDKTGLYALRWAKGKIQLQLIAPPESTQAESTQAESAQTQPLTIEIETQAPIANLKIWHHIAFSWEQKTQEVSLYVDGRCQNVVALQAQVQTLSFKNTYKSIVKFPAKQIPVDHYSIKLVPSETTIKKKSDFQAVCCDIAELRVWQVARPHSTIKAFMGQRLDSAEERKHGLLAYWRFDREEEFGSLSKAYSSNTPSSAFSPRPEIIVAGNKRCQFVDVDSQHWAYLFIQGLEEAGFLGSFLQGGATHFRPEAPMTRQELAFVLINAFGGKLKANRANVLIQFKDKETIDEEYLSDIEYVYRLGLMTGDIAKISSDNSDGAQKQASGSAKTVRIHEITFNPKNQVMRGVALSTIFDSLRDVWDSHTTLKNDEIDEDLEQVLARYQDVPTYVGPGKDSKFCAWIPRKVVALALQKGLVIHEIANSERLDLCTGIATRAEIAAMLYQALILQDQFWQTEPRVGPIKSDHILKGHAG